MVLACNMAGDACAQLLPPAQACRWLRVSLHGYPCTAHKVLPGCAPNRYIKKAQATKLWTVYRVMVRYAGCQFAHADLAGCRTGEPS